MKSAIDIRKQRISAKFCNLLTVGNFKCQVAYILAAQLTNWSLAIVDISGLNGIPMVVLRERRPLACGLEHALTWSPKACATTSVRVFERTKGLDTSTPSKRRVPLLVFAAESYMTQNVGLYFATLPWKCPQADMNWQFSGFPFRWVLSSLVTHCTKYKELSKLKIRM